MLDRIITHRATPWLLLLLALIGAPGIGISIFALVTVDDPAESAVTIDIAAATASMAASHTAAPQETWTPVPTWTPGPTWTPEPTRTATPTEEPPSATPIPSPVSPVAATATATGVVPDTATAAVVAATPTPTPSATPEPTVAATATLTPTPELVCGLIPADPGVGWIQRCRDVLKDTPAYSACSTQTDRLTGLRVRYAEATSNRDVLCEYHPDYATAVGEYRSACEASGGVYATAVALGGNVLWRDAVGAAVCSIDDISAGSYTDRLGD